MSCNAPDLDLQCWWKTKEININILIVKGGGLSPFSPPPGCTFGGTWQERSTLLLSGAGLGWLFASSSPVRASKQAQECDMWYEVFAKLTWNVQITWKGKPKQTSSFSYPLIHQAVGQSPEPAETNLNDFVNKNQCMRLHYSVTVSAGGSKILTRETGFRHCFMALSAVNYWKWPENFQGFRTLGLVQSNKMRWEYVSCPGAPMPSCYCKLKD